MTPRTGTSDPATAAGSLRQRAESWIAADPDPDTVAELRHLLDADDEEALADRFAARLQFGTAGIRGELGAGPNRMNRLVVRWTVAGVVRRLLGEPGSAARARTRGVAIGFDARHKSAAMAADAAAVCGAHGVPVHLFDQPVPTPVLAYTVRELGCAAGLMVTASHNPPRDNGMKVYWGDGAQIAPPLDAEIAAAIDAIVPAELADHGRANAAATPTAPTVPTMGDQMVQRYLDAVLERDCRTSDTAARAALRVVHTALHGVGDACCRAVLARAGFTDVHPVVAQQVADPDFPTVAFPNPEEPGALDAALALAGEVDADLVLANDPDADRLGVAVRDGDGWRVLRGDEIGWLLADHLLAASAADGAARLVQTTVVSSSLLAAIAARHGVTYNETLTGFKWLARGWLDHPQLRMVLSYEEALGYAVHDVVRDKDGISAALVMADVAAACKAAGASVPQRLAALAEEYGPRVTRQWSLRSAHGRRGLAVAMAGLRAALPSHIGDTAVLRWDDYLARPGAADILVAQLADGSRVMVRPSGTEPKCKVYVESRSADTADALVSVAPSLFRAPGAALRSPA